MAPMSRGKPLKPSQVVKPTVKRNGTASTRNHVFQSFNTRITKLKIAPLRSSRPRPDLDSTSADLSSASSSYLATALAEWSERNLSTGFVAFADALAPLAESLPMVLHHAGSIMQLFETSLTDADRHALEPLCALLASFAHDLGPLFETYFAQAFRLVAGRAELVQEPECIEWCFEALAWVVKYMGRVLLEDNEMARQWWGDVGRWLGREKQRAFVVRFMGEVVGFLLRRAAKEEEKLTRVLGWLVEDFLQHDTDLYGDGIKVAVSEAVKGINRGVHSAGILVFTQLVQFAYGRTAEERARILDALVQGSLISVVHATDQKGFEPIEDTILVLAEKNIQTEEHVVVSSRLLSTMVATRKATRISDWDRTTKAAVRLVQTATQIEDSLHSTTFESVIRAIGDVFAAAPIHTAARHVQVLDGMRFGPWKTHFLSLCYFMAEISPDRFKSLLLTPFQKFIIDNWKNMESTLSVIIPRLNEIHAYSPSDLSCPQDWLNHMLDAFRQPHSSSKDQVAQRSAYLKVLESTKPQATEVRNSIAEALWSLIGGSDASSGTESSTGEPAFIYGQGFAYASALIQPTTEQLNSVILGAKSNSGLGLYLQGLLRSLERASQEGQTLNTEHLDSLTTFTIKQLRSPAHELRLLAIQVLEEVYKLQSKTWPEICEVVSSIESTSPSMQSGREISSRIRRLAILFKQTKDDEITTQIVVSYCFGLLHFKLGQAWEDSTQVLQEISSHELAEKTLLEITSEWLTGGQEPNEAPLCDWNPVSFQAARSDFECLNVNQVEANFSNALLACKDSLEKLEAIFDHDHRQIDLEHPFNRTQALRVLNAVPQLAEKRSRLLVPVLLQWTSQDLTEDSDESTAQRWNRKDQKAMLDVFAKFQNPRVLYKSAEVFDALMRLVANGDVEIQKSSLKALLVWKQPGVIRYEQHLLNFLDDAHFREEISIFLRVDEEEGIREEDLAELAPLLLRLLYGLLVNRSGNASGIRGKQSKRKAVFIALARFSDDILRQFINIALEPLTSTDGEEVKVHPRKQVGALNMLNDMLDSLGDRLEPFAIQMGDVALDCLLAAGRNSLDTDDAGDHSDASLLKSVRQTGFKCIEQLVKCCPEVGWTRHARSIVSELLVPRLDNFAIEFAQSLSSVFKLLSAWSLNSQTSLYLVEFSPRLIPVLADCITSEHAKPEVKKYVLDEIFEKLLDHHTSSSSSTIDNDTMVIDTAPKSKVDVTNKVLRPNAATILAAISTLLKASPSKELLDSGVSCVSRLADLIDQKSEAKDFIHIATFLLKQPSAKVSLPTKRRLLSAVEHLVPASDLISDDELSLVVYTAISPLFAFLRDREGRQLLCGVLQSLTTSLGELQSIAQVVEDLNSFAAGKVEEPDFERRSMAFTKINEELYLTMSPIQWQVVLHNMLFYIQDKDEVAIRASASFTLQRFIEAAVLEDGFKSDEFENLASKTLFSGLQSGMRNQSELVRIEYLAVLNTLVKRAGFWTQVTDLIPLLADNDDEASFFLNILHVQQHRRLRALRRLADQSKDGGLLSSNVATLFWPLIEHFIFDAAQEESAHNLTAEAVSTLSALTTSLEWSQYRAILRRYIAMMKNMEGKEKTTIRLIGSIIDGLHRSLSTPPATNGDVEIEAVSAPTVHTTLSKSLPKEASLSSTISDQFLPPLTSFLHLKDESMVSLRVPVGVVVVKLIKCLPEELMISKLPSVLLDLCHILRSRDQGARDMTRKTLAEITAMLGPAYFNFIVKELRSSLQRGYQLHVLSFTVHSIMVENLDKLHPGDLDHCIPDLIAVIMDDIFGVAGQEKDAEDYISKMKEVKSSKSFDSMELLAKITTLEHLNQLIKPIRSLLLEKLDLRTVKKIDELLRRLALGVTSNNAIIDRSILVFCYEIITLVDETKKPAAPNGKPLNDWKTKRYLIQMQTAHKSGKKGVTSSYTFKLVRFALDLLRSVLQKHEELKTPGNISGFVPVISEAMVSGQEEVQLSVMRLLTGIMRVPLPALESNSSVYVAEAVKVIKAASSMVNESAQAALKLMSSALRDRSSSKIKETDLAYVLKRLKPDLEQPDRQGVIFNFLRSVVGRKIVITEVYEVMDAVAAIMVTNQTRQARELSRGIYFQFMMDYPQGKDRLNKQVAFLVKNLEYAYPEGRQSVLELLHLLLQKTKGEITQMVSSMTFVPLVMMLANDDSPECREMAGALIKQILEKASDENKKVYLGLLRQWLEQEDQALLKRLAMQIWKMQIEVGSFTTKETDFLVRHIEAVLPDGENIIAQSDWEPLYYALQLFAEIAKASPEAAFSTKRNSLWNGVYRSLTFPHTWVKLSASRLVGLLYGDVGKEHQDTGFESLPLHASGGLQVSEQDLRWLCASSMRVLRHPGSSEQLLAQTCRNIVFLGRVFGPSGMEWRQQGTNAPDGEPNASDDEEVSSPEDDAATGPQLAAIYLLQSLSGILRRDPSSTDPATLPPKLAALQTQQALLSTLPAEQYGPALPVILHPLLVQTDASIPKPTSANPDFTNAQTRLTSLAREVLSAVQERAGTTAYVAAVTAAQASIRAAREERRVKRRIEAVSFPEARERRKGRKLEGKVRRRQEKGHEERGKRRGW